MSGIPSLFDNSEETITLSAKTVSLDVRSGAANRLTDHEVANYFDGRSVPCSSLPGRLWWQCSEVAGRPIPFSLRDGGRRQYRILDVIRAAADAKPTRFEAGHQIFRPARIEADVGLHYDFDRMRARTLCRPPAILRTRLLRSPVSEGGTGVDRNLLKSCSRATTCYFVNRH